MTGPPQHHWTKRKPPDIPQKGGRVPSLWVGKGREAGPKPSLHRMTWVFRLMEQVGIGHGALMLDNGRWQFEEG